MVEAIEVVQQQCCQNRGRSTASNVLAPASAAGDPACLKAHTCMEVVGHALSFTGLSRALPGTSVNQL
jgi:hypothetical protein